MKKKAFLWSVLAIMMVAVSGVIITACGDDETKNGDGITNGGNGDNDGDADDSSTNANNNYVIGTWTSVGEEETFTLIFKSNGTGVWITTYEDRYSGTQTDVEAFTYMQEGSSNGKILLRTYDSYSSYTTEVLYYSISGQTMYVKEEGDDDDDAEVFKKNAGSENVVNSSVTGTWKSEDSRESMVATFKSDKTGTYIYNYDDPYSGVENQTGTFTYNPESEDKGQIIMEVYDSYYGKSTEVYYYSIEGNTMFVCEDDYYADLEWILTKQ